jgi:lipopolysaccharide/colanic/teichoic acid biosynthesis glycosyltransferase
MMPGLGGPLITVQGDSRITRVGRILRKTKIDELPQLWNVLRGDMSLVGPRPEIPEYVEQFKARYERILAIRPGITDLASIRFRNEEELLAASREPLREYVERVLPLKLDLADEYIRTASFSSDLSILLRTAKVMIWK